MKHQNRATRLNFLVTDPQPLLAVKLLMDHNEENADNSSSSAALPSIESANSSSAMFMLQGQFQHGYLSLYNEGDAEAVNIDLKMNGANCIIYLDDDTVAVDNDKCANGRFLAPFGPSATVFKLPSSVKIPPKTEKRLRIAIRFELTGRELLSVLATYNQANKGTGLVDNASSIETSAASNAVENRTSFASFEFYIFPSLAVSVRIAPNGSSTSKRFLLVDVKSFVEPDNTIRDGANAESSVEDAYIQEDASFAAMDEGACTIEGVSLLGIIKPKSKRTNQMMASASMIRANEKLSVCIPVELSRTEHDNKRFFHPEVHWILPIQTNSSETANCGCYTNINSMSGLIEQSICQQIAEKRFSSDLLSAREAKKKEAEEADGAGPRTIAAVRRDRQAQPGMEDNIDDSMGDSEQWNASLSINKHESTRGSLAFGGTVPVNFHGIAYLEAREALSANNVMGLNDDSGAAERGGATVIVSWALKWRGSIRRGVHFVSNISVFTNAPISMSSLRSITGSASRISGGFGVFGANQGTASLANKVAGDTMATDGVVDNLISVSITHPSTVIMSKRSIVGDNAEVNDHILENAEVPVLLHITSTYNSPLKIAVDTSDKRHNSKHAQNAEGGGDQSASVASTLLNVKFLRWNGKSR
jgi:hypothetical protein